MEAGLPSAPVHGVAGPSRWAESVHLTPWKSQVDATLSPTCDFYSLSGPAPL